MPDVTPLSAIELQAMRERCEATPEGPWERSKYGIKQVNRGPYVIDEREMCEAASGYSDHPGDAVCEFIIACRSDIPRLLDELEHVRGLLEEVAAADREAENIDAASDRLMEVARKINAYLAAVRGDGENGDGRDE